MRRFIKNIDLTISTILIFDPKGKKNPKKSEHALLNWYEVVGGGGGGN